MLGSARASRAGDDALVIANFIIQRHLIAGISATAPKCAREGACAPQNSNRDLVELFYPFGLTDLNVTRI
jgi:hypothetical protein